MRVQVAVPEVVDGAACAAHDEGAGEEERRCCEDGGEWGDGAGEGSRHEGAEEAWEEEVVGPYWLVDADEFGVGDDAGGEVG